ncbi:hypothetical protein [Kitasatospora viridis]|uniref:Phage terminase large subunit-like protein n=1 Tax=Kitasatospora viridis TaxID=281105 RepID=A0A561SAD9_9ACTN|nr:hypothetical protein [Kitasatospora viridis]TWF71774.1 hypothetical protein FHX73_18145 [Kitasatospora viridis]
MPTPTTDRRSPITAFGPADIHHLFIGIDIPDPITFVVSPDYLDRPNLYPRQATLLKAFFLREDLFTPYDYEVLEEWDQAYFTGLRAKERAQAETDEHGEPLDTVKVDVSGSPRLLERMRAAKALGYQWFREILLVMGRRAGKGHISALAMAYVLWTYMAKGDPQEHYGVDRDKKLACLIFAGKREQAKANLWRDLVNVITGAPCFAPYIANSLGEKLSVYAPHDFVRMDEMAQRGITTALDMATFEILPKESTLMAGRGPASFIMGFDEMAHVVASGANRSAEEVYTASTPSLDQFKKDGFLIEPSSPWQMTGQFYDNYTRAVELNPDGTPAYPAMMMIQLASWDIYLDWQIAHELPLLPADFQGDNGEYTNGGHPGFKKLKGAIQEYDDQMRKLEQAEPDTFRVERRSQWATVMDAYLDVLKVERVFGPWYGRPDRFGPALITPTTQGILSYTYKGHADPSSVNCRFGIACAHIEYDDGGRPHVVFDKIHHFDPADFPEHTIDYDQVDDWIWDEILVPFQPEEFTFDQYNSVSSIQKLTKKVARARLPKTTTVFERTANATWNWKVAEAFKSAINMELVHAPEYEQAELELKFLQKGNGNKVDHPTIGPVQTKDIADAMMITTYALIGSWIEGYKEMLGGGPAAALQGGLHGHSMRAANPTATDRNSQETINALRSFSRTRMGRDRLDNPSRGRVGRRR